MGARGMKLDARTRLFIVLAGIFCTSLVVGDIIGGKLIETQIFGTKFTLTVGMIPFPITFLLTDVLNEFYGKKHARFVTLLGFGMAALAYAFIFVAGAIPIAEMTRAPGWTGVTDATFDNVFLGSQRMILASMVAYIIAQFVDIGVFHALKRLTTNRFLWLRATGSTAVSQLIDTIAITFVAWWGVLGIDQILTMIRSSYSLKILIAIGLTPLVYLCHALLERGLGLAPVRIDAEGEAVGQPPGVADRVS
jgi:uncharacterized integral membrane protein (TIGR00697 family)